jgi:hypothetical protein
MNNDRELLQQALDALQGNWRTDESDKAIEALRARLAQPEPDYEAEFIKDWNEGKVRRVSDGKRMVPEREWVGLTEQEHTELAIECGCLSADWVFYGAAVEQKLKEKNT